jgi:hypothetical protein
MFNKIFYTTFALGLLIKTLVIGCEDCLKKLEYQKKECESRMEKLDEDSAAYSFFQGMSIGIRWSISVYEFNHN